ncbi:MAG TPA: tol-pal system protein YbgF [Rhodocyclaceae bacterium]|nr:tol-pal system protein YbgF [Rhodocyclaceae bacterium]
MKSILVASLLLLALQAHAGLFDDDVARQRIDALQSQLNDLTQRGEDASRNQLDFTNQLEALRTDIAKMRGQLDELNYNLEAAQKRQKDFYIDLDNRLRRLEGGKADSADVAATDGDVATAPAPAPAPAPAVDSANEGKDYEAALVALKGSRFKESLAAFTAFIKNYPKSSQQASAYFWSGYIYGQLKDNAKAAEMYSKVAANWPADPRAPDALAEQAGALDALGDKAGARKVREQLVAKYPTTDAGRQARSALKKK